jgi:hypothetical protein
MLNYSGDLTPVLLASGTEITTGTTVTVGLFTNANSAQTARLDKPMFYVKVTTSTAATGSMTIVYQEKINDFHVGVDKTVTVTMNLVTTGNYLGVTAFTNDFSAITVKSVTNDLDVDIDTYNVYLTGLVGGE